VTNTATAATTKRAHTQATSTRGVPPFEGGAIPRSGLE
jgi:hypothetical protein